MSGNEGGHITLTENWRLPRTGMGTSCAMLGSLHWDLSDLASHLRRERLFVMAEQQHLQQLNEKVALLSSDLAQLAWVSSHQRVNLNHLRLARVDCLPALICQRNYTPDNVLFVDAIRVLGYQDAVAYGEFLALLRDYPELVAGCLSAGDKTSPELMPGLLHSLSAGLFGSCLLAEDKVLVLKLLRQLTVLQLVPSDNPRRLLRHGSCAFARLYSVFHENLYSAKLFLTAALHDPIMKLLMEDEMFLDIDPAKAVVRYPPEERMRKFGPENTPEHTTKLQRYRDWTVQRLVALTEHFIASLREHVYCFPSSVCWLVRQMVALFAKAGYLGEKEIFEICIDLVFTYFICPAIVNPEPYGITDAPISYVARFNLMQVAQILQMLAMRKYEDVDPKVADLYSQFRVDSVSSFIERILEDTTDCLDEQPWTEENVDIEGLQRSAALFTHTQLNSLVRFLQSLLKSDDERLDRRQLETLLARLPPVVTNGHKTSASKGSTDKLAPEIPLLKKPGLLSKAVGKQRSQSINSAGTSSGSGATDSGDDGASIGPDGPEQEPEQVLVIPLTAVGEGLGLGLMTELKVLQRECRVVMPLAADPDLRSAVPAERLSSHTGHGGHGSHGSHGAHGGHGGEGQEKRTRFSLSHDEGSIGNTSDNLEAVSEAASNHSGASSLESENEDQNDNLSDMVSANVSGRGTPNISAPDLKPIKPEVQSLLTERQADTKDFVETVRVVNKFQVKESFPKVPMSSQEQDDEVIDAQLLVRRDTPSSQITEGEEGRGGEGEELRGGVPEHRSMVPAVSKQTRSDIEDKFGKFEIKKQELLGDETISLASDTWSTDVLASDGETVEQSERGFPRPPDDPPPHPFIQHSLDMSETASEAWSTDVLASDSERLTEVDTDDTASVARSDDTAHSEFGTRGETPPPPGPLPPLPQVMFRPIPMQLPTPPGRASLAVPPSPTRGADGSTNVTGRGGAKADYRRRTLEFVDAGLSRGFTKACSITVESTRMIHVIDKMDMAKPTPITSTPTLTPSLKGVRGAARARSPHPSHPAHPAAANGVVSPPLEPQDSEAPPQSAGAPPQCPAPEESQRLLLDQSDEVDKGGDEPQLFDDSDVTPPSPLLSNPVLPPPSLLPMAPPFHKPQTSSFMLTGKYAEMKMKQEQVEESERVFLSSTSLASTSSSGSNSGPGPGPSPGPSPGPQSVVRAVDKVALATGAIPKSISFDKTAERGDKEFMDDDQKQKKGFFRNFKMSFKAKKVKQMKGEEAGRFQESVSGEPFGGSRFRRGISEESAPQNGDVMEDILAKYRSKAGTEPGEPGEAGELVCSPRDLMEKKLSGTEEELGLSDESLFINAKRKLRLVLCNSDLQSWPSRGVVREHELLSFLQLQLAEAINLQNRSLVSQLHETIRCVRLFDDEGCRRLFQSLKEDYQSRAPYIAYLVRSRQTLLASLAHLERMADRLRADSQVCTRFLVALCVRFFLERREDKCRAFTVEFQNLALADEKTDLLDKFLSELAMELERDTTWQGASEAQLDQAQSIIETAMMSRVYPYALFPNGDGDISRDQVLNDHIKKLSSIITPNHKDLRIPKRYHVECPWPSAQAEVSSLPAYKTPRDKVACVCRCVATIMNLLSMASEGNVPAADDLMPVLVFVLIAANPPSLLSTVQYVESFFSSRLEGEEQYWWTQFSSAIEFIKTMDYSV